MPVLQTGLAKSGADYTIDQSLRFNQTDSYLSRTVGTATSNRIGTFSFWTKMGNLANEEAIVSNYSDSNNRTYVNYYQNGIEVYGKISGSSNIHLQTTAAYRDPSAWYHVVIAIDVTQGTASDRVKIYVNGD